MDVDQNQHELRVDVAGHHVEAFKDAREWNVGQIQINHVSNGQGSNLVGLLKPIPDASHTRNRVLSPPNSRCFPGTRGTVIKDIHSWIDSSLLKFTRGGLDPHILWIYGYAGCGKSAIAQVVAEHMASQDRLAASFFFFRGSGERSTVEKFAATIASQVAAAIPATAPIILNAINANPGLTSTDATELGAQFQHLIYDPIDEIKWERFASPLRRGPFLIVLDGVDECEDRTAIATFIEHMIEYFDKKPRTPLRFIITSRVESHLHQRLHSSNQVKLLDLVGHTSDDDIAAALEVAIAKETSHRALACTPSWPSPEDRLKLVKHIGGSYIFMTTIIRLLFDPQYTDGVTPMDRLPLVLATSPDFDELYRTILFPCVKLPYFRDILNTVALACVPLSISQIADMLEIRAADVVYALIDLHAIMQIPGDDHTPVTLWHSSLRDFLCSKHRAKRLFASPTFHLRMAHRCAALCSKSPASLSENPLLNYSRRFGREHFKRSVAPVGSDTICVFAGELGKSITGILKGPFFGGQTAFEGAARDRNWSLVKCFLKANASVNTRFKECWDGISVALHAACRFNEKEMVSFLLKQGADPNIINPTASRHHHVWGFPLAWAVANRHADLVDELLACGANPDQKGDYSETALHACFLKAESEIIRMVVRHGKGQTYLERIRDHDGRCVSLHSEPQKEDVQLMKCLLESGAYPNAQNDDWNTPLHFACRGGTIEAVELLLNHSFIDSTIGNKDGDMPLHVACFHGNIETVKCLIRHNADITMRNNHGDTPLHFACRGGDVKMVELLLSHDACLTTRNHNGYTPFHEACRNKHLTVAELLLNHDANPATQNVNGNTPLHHACQKGEIQVVKFLLTHKADTTIKNNIGDTPLHRACYKGIVGIIESVLKGNVDPTIKNNEGKTALEVARERTIPLVYSKIALMFDPGNTSE